MASPSRLPLPLPLLLLVGAVVHSGEALVRSESQGLRGRSQGPRDLLERDADFWKGNVPEIIVDLDLPPEHRWDLVCAYYNKTFPGMFSTIWDRKDKAQSHCDEDCWKTWNKVHDPEALAEARGMARATGTPLALIMLRQIGYEMNFPHYNKSCSGVLVAQPDGTVVHGRNMDYENTYTWHGRDLTIDEVTVDVLFMKNGKPLISSVTWPMQLGIHTAMRIDGGWSFEHNTRDNNDMNKNMNAARWQGSKPFSWTMRKMMENIPDFETALETVNRTHWMAPQYFIMAGSKPYEGAVVTLDRSGRHLKDTPPVQRLSAKKGGYLGVGAGPWYLVQTNDDVNKAPGDNRRNGVRPRILAASRKHMNERSLFNIMRGWPLKQGDTVFTWIATPSTGKHKTYQPQKETGKR